MAKNNVTYAEIEAQANLLLSHGENPTLERVRRALGNRGSNTTLSKYMNEWRAQQTRSLHLPQTPAISDPVSQAVNRVWEQLHTESKTEIEKIKTESRDCIEKVSKENEKIDSALKAALIEVDKLANNILNYQKENELLKNEKQELKSEIKRLRNEIDKSHTQILAFKNHHEELKLNHEFIITEFTKSNQEMIATHTRQIQDLHVHYQKQMNELRQGVEAQCQDWQLKNDSLKVEVLQLQHAYQKVEAVEHQSQILIKTLSEKLDSKNNLLAEFQKNQTLQQEQHLKSEKTIIEIEKKLLQKVFELEIGLRTIKSLEDSVFEKNEIIKFFQACISEKTPS